MMAQQQGFVRVDVSRHSGDTFQFHAFYRSLRELLSPILSESDMMPPPPAVQPSAGATFAGVPGFTVNDRAHSQQPPPPHARSPRSASMGAMAGLNALGAWTRRAGAPARSSQPSSSSASSKQGGSPEQTPIIS